MKVKINHARLLTMSKPGATVENDNMSARKFDKISRNPSIARKKKKKDVSQSIEIDMGRSTKKSDSHGIAELPGAPLIAHLATGKTLSTFGLRSVFFEGSSQ